MAKYLEFDITLREASPAVWRRLLLAVRGSTFLDLHNAIQDACDWTHSHLWCFLDAEGEGLATFPNDDEGFPGALPAHEVSVGIHFKRPGHSVLYVYDMGDGWEHEVTLRKQRNLQESFHRRLLDGARAFPPEDCGGIPGYYACLAAAGAKIPKQIREQLSAEEIEERREWLGDWRPDHFDRAEAAKHFDTTSAEEARHLAPGWHGEL